MIFILVADRIKLKSKFSLLQHRMNFLSSLTYLTGGFGLLSIFAPILTPFLFILRLFSIHYYTIRNDEERIRMVIKHLQKHTISSQIIYQYGNSFPSGTFIGLNYVGYYQYASQREGGTGEVHMVCTKEAFTKIIEACRSSSAVPGSSIISQLVIFVESSITRASRHILLTISLT